MPLYLVLDLCLLLSELALVWRRRAAASPSPSPDRNSLRVLWLTISVAMTLGHFLARGGIGPRLPGVGSWRAGLGVGIFAAGVLLRAWAIRHLGRFFTVGVALAADHRVVDDGPYRRVRHPSYTGLLLEFAGVGIVLGSWLGLAVILVPIGAALAWRIHVEESALRGRLGEAYATYARGTWRLVPGVY